MSASEYAILAAGLIGFGLGSLVGFAAGYARLRDVVADRIRIRRRARYRRVGSLK